MKTKQPARNAAVAISETDLLKLQNLALRQQLLTQERQATEREIVARYENPGEVISIMADGTIQRSAPKQP